MIRFVDKGAEENERIVLFGGKRGGAMSDAVVKKVKAGAADKAQPKKMKNVGK